MATTKKTATKGSKTIAKATANVVSKVETTAKVSAKADKVQPTAEETAAKAAKTLDRLVTKVTNEVMVEVKNSVLGLSSWLNTFKRIAIKHDPQIASLFADDQKWFSFVIKTKMGLDHVVVLSERENKETGEKETIRRIVPTMWVRKTDKVSIPTDFTKGKVESYRFYDKLSKSGSEIYISDGKELEVTRSVKVVEKELLTNAEGMSYYGDKIRPNAEGIMKKCYTLEDRVFVPLPQLDFDFKEVNEAIKAAMLATFGSEAVAK